MFKVIEKVLASGNAEALVATSIRVSQAYVQVKRSNSAKIEIGPKCPGESDIVTDKAYELVKPTADAQLAQLHIVPTGDQNNEDLANWQILGTTGQGVNIIYEEF